MPSRPPPAARRRARQIRAVVDAAGEAKRDTPGYWDVRRLSTAEPLGSFDTWADVREVYPELASIEQRASTL